MKYAAIIDDAELVKELLKDDALNPESGAGGAAAADVKIAKEDKNKENRQILTACVELNNITTLELLLQPVMKKLTMTEDNNFFKQLLENTAHGAPKILGAILRRVNPEEKFYKPFLKKYVQLIVLHMDAQDEQEEFRSFIWKSQWPLHAALLCSTSCRELSLQLKLNEASFRAHEETFEAMACTMLEACRDQIEASMVLTERAKSALDESTPLNYAIENNRKTFVSHRFFQKAYQKLWYVHSAEAAAYEVAARRGDVGPIEDLFTRPMRPKWAMDTASWAWCWCRSQCCRAVRGLGGDYVAPEAALSPRDAPATGSTIERHNTMKDVLDDFTDDAQKRKRREKEDLKRRASRNLKCDRNLFDGDDDTEAAAAAAGSGKRKFAAETWSERALNASWMCGVCGCLLLVLVLMTPFRALAPVCPPLAKVTRNWLYNNEFNCAFFKFAINTFTYILFLGVLGYYILNPKDTVASVDAETGLVPVEVALLMWIVSYFFGELEQLWKTCYRPDDDGDERTRTFSFWEGVKEYFSNTLQRYDMVMWLSFIASFVIRIGVNIAPGKWGHLAVADPSEVLDVADVTLAVSSFMVTSRLLHVCSINNKLGPLFVMLMKMTKDISMFMYLFAVSALAYLFAFSALLRSEDRARFGDTTLKDSRSIALQLLFGLFDLMGDESGYCFGGGDLPADQVEECAFEQLDNGSELVKYWVYTFMLFMFLLQAVVTLTNLLIAMMSSTYETVQEHSEIEWKFSQVKLIRDYQSLPSIPPPLNLFALPFRVTAFLCSVLFGDHGGGIFGKKGKGAKGLVPRFLPFLSLTKYWTIAWSYVGGDAFVDAETAKKEDEKKSAERFQLMSSKNIDKRKARVAVVQRYVNNEEHEHVQSTEERLKRIARDIRVLDVELFGGGRQLRNYEQLQEHRQKQMEQENKPQRLW